jgi:threonine dehydrogenase-like Zn-dependent dehydrogenase
VHTSATAAGLGRSLQLLRREGTVVELSWYGDRETPVALGDVFHSERLTIRGSQVGSVSPARRNSRTHADRLALAASLLRDDAFDALLTTSSTFEELPDALPRLASGELGTLTHLVTYPGCGTEGDPCTP